MEIYHEVAPLLEEFSRMGLGDSKELPQIDLYMDQVIILLNGYLRMIKDENGENEQITKNMINNYVKMKVVPAPIKKKYSKTHIAYLVIVCVMKQIYSISMIKNMLPDFDDEQGIIKTYNCFVRSFKKAVNEDIGGMINEIDEENGVLELSSKAIALKLLAEKVIR